MSSSCAPPAGFDLTPDVGPRRLDYVVHCLLGLSVMASPDRDGDLFVVGQRLRVVADRLRVQRPYCLERDARDVVDVQQQIVVRRDEHRTVKGKIGLDERVRVVDRCPKLGHGRGDGATLRRAGRLCGEPGSAWFECHAQVGQHFYVVGRCGRGVPPPQHVRIEEVPRLAGPHQSASAGAAFQQSLSGKHFHALAQRGPAHVELADQFVLGRDSRTWWQLPADDLRAEAVDDLRVASLLGIGGSHGVLRLGRWTDRLTVAVHLMKRELHQMKPGRADTCPVTLSAMQLVRFTTESTPQLGILDGGVVTALTGVDTLAALLALPYKEIRAACASAAGPALPLDRVRLLAPADGRCEIWAAGVTYERSRDARVLESKESADVYDRVYSAERPELFFKSVAWRAVGPGGSVSVRADSDIDVPEPELAVVLNRDAEVVGYTICNDMSSRSIEGENPLYLPQAKIYLGGCAIGPGIRPAWEVADAYALTIEMTIERDGDVAWSGSASTARLHRRIDELVGYLFRENDFPDGAILSTGTSVVPDLPFTLHAGDEIRIDISEVGTLVNGVVRGKHALPYR